MNGMFQSLPATDVGVFAAAAVKTLIKYDRAFLIDCSRLVDARMLKPNWAKLCLQFKDVCLSPQVHVCYRNRH